MKNRNKEDLFKDTTMTFGEHLEELRACLFKSLIGLIAGFLIGMLVADQVVKFIQEPLISALEEFYLAQAKADAARRSGPQFAAEIEAMITLRRAIPDKVLIEPAELSAQLQDPGAPVAYYRVVSENVSDLTSLVKSLSAAGAAENPVTAHLRGLLSEQQRSELDALAAGGEIDDAGRQRIVDILNDLLGRRDLYHPTAFENVTLAEYLRETGKRTADLPEGRELRQFNWQLLAAAFPLSIAPPSRPLAEIYLWRPIKEDPRLRPQSLGVQEAFMIWVKAALLTGFLITCPWIFYQVWTFVAAGMYPHERKYIHIYLPFSIILFLAGAALAFFFVFQPVLEFLLGFNASLGVDPDPRIGEWLNFVLLLPLGFGVSFQLPLVMLFLQRIGIFDVQSYLSKWRIAILTIFILSAVLTPADPYSMLLMALPLTVLYFGGIALCRWLPANRNPFDDE